MKLNVCVITKHATRLKYTVKYTLLKNKITKGSQFLIELHQGSSVTNVIVMHGGVRNSSCKMDLTFHSLDSRYTTRLGRMQSTIFSLLEGLRVVAICSHEQ